MNLKQSEDLFITQMVRRRRADGTLVKYRQVLDHFNERTGALELADMTEDTINKYSDARDDLCSSSLHAHLRVLRSFCHFLLRRKLIEVNPFMDIMLPKFETPPRNTLTLEQCLLVLEYMPETQHYYTAMRSRIWWHLMILEGLRVSEVRQLRISDIRDDEVIIRKGKGGKGRIIPLLPRCARAIKEYIPMLPFRLKRRPMPEDWLFPGHGNEPVAPVHISVAFKRAADALGLTNVSAHCLRHTYATTLVDSDVDIRVIQTILGHSSLQSTQIYAHVSTVKMAQAVAKHPLAK